MRYMVLAVPLIAIAASVSAQELPPEEDLASRVTVPGFWEIQEFRIIAQAMVGTPIEPRAQIRFEADASPRGDLFVPSGPDGLGPFVTVIASTPDETVRTLYGTMDLTYMAGQWNGPVVIENPIDGLGQPLDSFTSPTLVLGSERQMEVAESLRSTAAADLRIALGADRQRLMEEQAAEIESLRAAHLAEISALRQAHDAEVVEIEDLRSGMESEAARIEAEIESRRAEALARLSEQLGIAEEEHKAELDALRGAHDVRMRELKTAQSAELGAAVTAHLEELRALETEHARAMGALVAEQEREMAELTTKLETRRASLEGQIATADEVLALQAALAARQTAIGVNDESIRAAEQQRQAEFGQSLEAFKGTWTGLALCTYQSTDQTYTVTLTLENIAGRSIRGTMSNPTWRTRDTTVHLLGNDLTLPLELKVTILDNQVIGTTTLDMTLQSDGWLVGQSPDGICSEVRLSKA